MGRPPCCDKNGLMKGPWTADEDQKLFDYIQKHGYGNWRKLPNNAGLKRCGKSCRLRWTNYLRPDIKRGRFSFGEEETIIQLHSILGNKWSAMAARLPGRTDNEIKNYWNTHIRKRLLRNGIDPVTHAPRLDLSSILSMNPNSHFLKFAASLISAQNQNQNELFNQYQQLIESNNYTNQIIFSDEKYQELQLDNIPNVGSNFTINQLSEWPINLTGNDDVANIPYSVDSDCYYQPILDYISSDNNNNDVSNQNFMSFATSSSVLSTPGSSSCPTPLNSYNNIEDVRESYYNNYTLKFENIPDILNNFVNEML